LCIVLIVNSCTIHCVRIACETQVEMERIAWQNLEAELQRTLEKLSSATASYDKLQQRELVGCLYDVNIKWNTVFL